MGFCIYTKLDICWYLARCWIIERAVVRHGITEMRSQFRKYHNELAGSFNKMELSEKLQPGACVVCGGTEGIRVYEEAGFAGLQCRCGSVYIDPQPLNEQTDPRVDLHLETYYSLPSKIRVDWVVKHIQGNRYLDVGAGNGATVSEALERGLSVAAIEPNSACVESLCASYGIQVEQSIIEESSLPDRTFDAVFHIDLLSHFPDPVLALQKMANLVKPETGVVCFEVGLFGGLSTKWYDYAGRPGFPQHRWFFSEKNIVSLLEQAGLEAFDMKVYNVSLSTILSSLLYKALPSRFRQKPGSKSLQAAKPGYIWKLYHRLHFFLRYRVGGWLPVFGPGTALVAARVRKPVGLQLVE